jgi:tRNA pseudouridine38-40 synthase
LYHGWQIQPGATTVQKTLDDALSLILGEEVRTTGAGRTDTGVHASFFCAHIESTNDDLDIRKNLIFRINKYLPKDISINSIRKVVPDAHARFSALSRTYCYYITRAKDPFREDSTWYLYGDLDIAMMNQACRILEGHYDFTSFSRLHTDVKTNNCKIFFSEWKEDGTKLTFTIKADRFLRNMVRSIVGTMIEVGQHKLSLVDFNRIIEARNRCNAGQSAPAKGLFLTDIEYPDALFI